MAKQPKKRAKREKNVNNPNHMDNLKPFSKDNQPTPEQKRAGWKHKQFMEEMANVALDPKSDIVTAAAQIAATFGITVPKYTLPTIMLLRQIEKAYKKADTPAFNAAMDRLVSKAQQNVDVTTNGKDLNPINKIIYIGLTYNIRKRERDHISNGHREEVTNLVAKFGLISLTPKPLPAKEAAALEIRLIAKYRALDEWSCINSDRGGAL